MPLQWNAEGGERNRWEGETTDMVLSLKSMSTNKGILVGNGVLVKENHALLNLLKKTLRRH
jgi:hypothetical protein